MDARTDWKIERALEALLLLFLIAAVAGVFGGRPGRSTARASAGGTALEVRYDPVTRGGLKLDLEATVRNTREADARAVHLRVDKRYMDGFSVERVVPQPDRESLQSGSLVLEYGRLRAGQAMDIRIRMEAGSMGKYPARVGAHLQDSADWAVARFRTTVMP